MCLFDFICAGIGMTAVVVCYGDDGKMIIKSISSYEKICAGEINFDDLHQQYVILLSSYNTPFNVTDCPLDPKNMKQRMSLTQFKINTSLLISSSKHIALMNIHYFKMFSIQLKLVF